MIKTSVCLFFFLLFFTSTALTQTSSNNADGSGIVVLDNDKIEVIEYVGKPQGNVCGMGEHHHAAHLTVALTDATVLLTSAEGEQQTTDIPADAVIWFDAGTHSAMNKGNNETRLLLVYLKE